MVLDKLKTDGIGPTIRSVKAKLNQPLPLGYSNVGTVIEVSNGVSGFSVGDQVVSKVYGQRSGWRCIVTLVIEFQSCGFVCCSYNELLTHIDSANMDWRSVKIL